MKRHPQMRVPFLHLRYHSPMTDNEWQTRVLSDDEIQALLQTLGPLEGMSVLQRQFELRSAEAAVALEAHASSSSALQSLDERATPTDSGVDTAVDSEAVAAPGAVSSQPASDLDIVNNLNAIFASQNKSNEGSTPLSSPVESADRSGYPEAHSGKVEAKYERTADNPAAVSGSEFSPRHIEAETKNQFIPTFSNPLPDTENVVVVTPMALPSQPIAPPAPLVVDAVAFPAVPEFDSQSASPALANAKNGDEVVEEIDEAGSQENFDAGPDESSHVESAPASSTVFAAEESVLVIEEQPHGDSGLVDSVIIESGGVEDEVPATASEEIVKAGATEAATGKSGVLDLLATWNGTGSLLFLAAAGYVAGANGYNLTSIIVGAFAALVIAGFGFGTAALAARRGRQPQSTTSRAAFGVRGAAIPLVFIIIARFAATAMATVGVALALRWYVPAIANEIKFAGYYWDGLSVTVVGVLLLATVLTILGTLAHLAVTRFVSILSVVGLAAVSAFAIANNASIIGNPGTVDSGHALAIASVVIIFISVVWGTTATDETPNLRNRLVAPKLLASGVLNFTILGVGATVTGFLYSKSYFGLQVATGVSVLFALLATFALAHQIKRSADSFSGFGLQKTRWWVVLLSSLFVGAAALVAHLSVAEPQLVSAALSLLPVAGVPVVAWLAIFGMDTVLRTDDYHEVSLLRNYGFYGKFRLVNLFGWLSGVALGFGFLDSNVPGFTWLGYLAKALNLSLTGLQADMGVWIAFLVGLVSPLFTIPAIRDQEAEGRALRARHTELLNIAGEN